MKNTRKNTSETRFLDRRWLIGLTGLAAVSGSASAQVAPAPPQVPACLQQVGTNYPLAGRAARSLAYGPTPTLLEQLAPSGQVPGWIAQQLLPDSIAEDPLSPMHHLLALLDLPTQQGDPVTRKDVAFEQMIRAIYSKRQLRERMTRFWINHFTQDVSKVKQFFENNTASAYWLQYDQIETFRYEGMGDFETLLFASATSPLMLEYLDANKNSVGKPNENYAREVMELHTLGVANEFGQENYTDLDVALAAKVFTGWEYKKVPPAQAGNPNAQEVDASVLLALAQAGDVDMDGYVGPLDEGLMQALIDAGGYLLRYDLHPVGAPNGRVNLRDLDVLQQNLGFKGWVWAFRFEPTRHDYSVKTLFTNIPHVTNLTVGGGMPLDPNGWREGTTLLTHLADQAQTANYISEKLSSYLLDDLGLAYPTALIGSMRTEWLNTGGDIGSVLTVLFGSSDWSDPANRWGKVKTPYEFAMSLARIAAADAPLQATPTLTLHPINWLFQWLQNDLQFHMFHYHSPEGFPESGGQLQGTYQTLKRNHLAQFYWESNSPQVTPWPNFEWDILGLLQVAGVDRNNESAVINYFSRLFFQCNWTNEDFTLAHDQLTDGGTIVLANLTDPQWEANAQMFLGLMSSLPQFFQQ